MKKKPASQSAFFNLRVLIGFVLCSTGVLLAFAGLTKSVTGMSTATGSVNPVPLINQPLIPDAIAPGGVETPVWDAVPMFADRAREIGRDAAFAELASMTTPLGRYATAEEIAGQIAFLLSDQAATITGSVLVTDGGYTL